MEQLIRRSQQGDRESMGRLYTVMHDELLAQCRRYAANDCDAEDLLHDAFLLIFSNIGKVHSPEKGRRWMHKVTKNVCLLYVQHRQSRSWVPIEEVKETSQGAEPDMAVTYEELLKAIDQLPRGYRQVFRLSVLEGMTHQQIAELTGIEPHTSSSQLLRAKKHLRQLVQLLMLTLILAVPFGAYYLWSLHDKDHDVAEADTTTTDTQEAGMREYPHEPTDQGQIATAHSEDANRSISKSSPALTVDHSTVRVPKTVMVDSNKAKGEDNASNNILVAEKPVVAGDSVATEKTLVEEDVRVAENDKVKQEMGPVHEIQPTPILEGIIPGIAVKSEKNEDLSLSLAYSGLPNGAARSLPYGAKDMNGDIDSVTHHRLPMTVTLNGRYGLGTRWWLDGGIRYSLLSSETRVGNTYLFMEQQQRVRYLGLSLGVGHDFWRSRHWNLYATTSVVYELPLRSTLETSYWEGGRLIDAENVRLNPHVQWSIGAGIGLQYDFTPAIGLFAEPSLQYYFHNSDGINTWRTNHTFTPLLPFGLRISF